MTETLAHGYLPESTRREQSNEYKPEGLMELFNFLMAGDADAVLYTQGPGGIGPIGVGIP